MGLTPESVDLERFLEVLGQECQGETVTQLSMYTVGEKLGLDREHAGRIGEEVIAQGWAEIRTLAGDIGITAAGLEHLAHFSGHGDDREPSLGSQPLLDESHIAYLDGQTAELKAALGQSGLDYDTLAEVVSDLRCLDAQMASPRVKTAIVRPILEDITTCLAGKLQGQILPGLKKFIT